MEGVMTNFIKTIVVEPGKEPYYQLMENTLERF